MSVTKGIVHQQSTIRNYKPTLCLSFSSWKQSKITTYKDQERCKIIFRKSQLRRLLLLYQIIWVKLKEILLSRLPTGELIQPQRKQKRPQTGRSRNLSSLAQGLINYAKKNNYRPLTSQLWHLQIGIDVQQPKYFNGRITDQQKRSRLLSFIN